MISALVWKGDGNDWAALRREIRRLEARVLVLENKEPREAGRLLGPDPEAVRQSLKKQAEKDEADLEKVVEVSPEEWERRWLRH